MSRVSPPGFNPREATLRFRFEGRTIEAAPGESIAAALAVAGELSLRETRTGERRGPFCGMGICHDCLVSADRTTVRACMIAVTEGLDVRRHTPRLPAVAAAAPHPAGRIWEADIVVVGAGPAGLSAAIAAAGQGAAVLVVDERKEAGGQYFKQPVAGIPVTETALDRQFREGREQRQAAERLGVRFLQDAAAWASQDGDLLVDTLDGAWRIRGRRIVLATGAVERCPPFPGWTLTGVMTTGAAQTFLRAYGVAPGRRVVIAGAGPLNLQLASELVAVGVEVVAVAEASAAPRAAWLPHLARMAFMAPHLVRDGFAYRWRLRRAKTPVLYRAVIAGAEGDGRVTRALIAPMRPDGSADRAASRAFDCDLVCVGYGFAPAVELAASMGCDLAVDRRWKHLAIVTDGEGRTSLPHVFAAGDGARFGGARVAMAAGRIAGLAAARDLDASRAATATTCAAKARRDLDRARAFQDALWRLYGAAWPGLSLAAPQTLVCRCEHVSLAMIEAAVLDGASGPGAVKRATRLGMGRCQGRYCAGVTAALLVARAGREPVPEDYFAPRTPIRPVSIGTVASLSMEDA